MASSPPLRPPLGPPPSRALAPTVVVGLAFVAFAALAALGLAGGCSFDNGGGDVATFHDGGDNDGGDAQYFEVGDDAAPVNPLCGDLGHGSCNPDKAELCTPLDAGSEPTSEAGDETSSDARDAMLDTFGSGTRNACRVVRISNKVTTTCAAAGLAAIDSFCVRDADCAPGLACVGNPSVARCLPYCCGETDTFDPCHVASDGGPPQSNRYCAAVPLAERPSDSVPVCVQPDNCTLLGGARPCSSDATCTVVTQYGDTACVPYGSCRDQQPCNKTACDRDYACLGPRGNRVCRHLCRLDSTSNPCLFGRCEAQSSFPIGYGLCTVDRPDAAEVGAACE